jgi:dynein heavy chain, axonemal
LMKIYKMIFSSAPRDGAYVYGIFMEGARWDITQGVITDSKLKELYPPLPVINIRVRREISQ